MHTKTLKIIGCGGQGKVVIDALSLCAENYCIQLLDDNPELLHKKINGFIVESSSDCLSIFKGCVHIALGDNHHRMSLSKKIHPDACWLTICHPAAVISNSAQIAEGSFIAARAILGPYSEVGAGCIINHGAVVDHDVKIGACSHIAPNSVLGGQVRIGKNVLIGSGAVVLPGITIADNAIIGSGAVVVRDVMEYQTVKGVPAR